MEGAPVDDCHTAAFQKAVKRAQFEPLRWHDLRHYPERQTMPSPVGLALFS